MFTALLSPIILFFVLGVLAGLFKSTLALPKGLGKGLSIYLMLAIGFKGGVEMAHATFDTNTITTILAGVFSSFLIPIMGFFILQKLTSLDKLNRAAVSAHYGSISVVTFVAATAYLLTNGIEYAGYIVAVVTLMEVPAIMSGLLLARGSIDRAVIKEVLLNGSVVLLLGSLIIGWVTGDQGMSMMEAFIGSPFKGVLGLFLLDMGLLVSSKLKDAKSLQPGLIGFGVLMPLVSAAMALVVAVLLGLSPGTATLLLTLCASASYIAVPAAMRVALPEANPAFSLTLALGITFPFNVVLGIPIYYWACNLLLGT